MTVVYLERQNLLALYSVNPTKQDENYETTVGGDAPIPSGAKLRRSPWED